MSHITLRQVAWMCVSLLFGFVSIFPAITIRLDSTSGFRGIEMQATDAESHYAARVQEVRDGFIFTSDVFYGDQRSQPYLQPPIPEWAVAGFGRLFGLDAARSLILSQFLFGTIVCAVMIGCFSALTGRFWWSLLGVAAYVFTGFMYSGPWMAWWLLTNTQGTLEFLTFVRPINPQWSATLFFGALWAFIVWNRTRSRKALAVAGVLTILSFYSYVYVWTLLGGIYAVIGIKELFAREYARVKELLVLAAALILGFIPYAWDVWNASHHPLYAETSMRFGLIHSRHPVFGIALGLLVLLAVIAWKRWRAQAWIIIALAITAILVQNQQIITGTEMVLSHYHWYFTKPFAMILGTMLVGSWMYDRWGRRFVRQIPAIAFCAPFIVILAAFGLLYQYRSYQAWMPFWRDQQSASGVIAYLRDHTHPGDVTYASGFIRDLIPVYTSGDVYWATNAYGYLSSDERARNAYFFDLWLKGVTADEADKSFAADRREELSSRIHAIYYREARGSFGAISDEEVSENTAAYRAFLDESIEAKLGKYPLNFIVHAKDDPKTSGWEELMHYSTSIYQDDAYEIRKVQGG